MRKISTALAVVLATAFAVAATATAAPPPGVQTADQSAVNTQNGTAASSATQQAPSNTNIAIRVLSPGNDGSVAQANTVGSTATANNTNTTSQSSDQAQAGGGGIQTGTQSAVSSQLAAALSLANQLGATNGNAPVSVGSTGNGGAVSQSNDAASAATAGNANRVGQSADQAQAGSSCGCASGSGVQTSDQAAANDQTAAAGSSATQTDPSNTNISIRVLSPGNDGAVSQSNTAGSRADAANRNDTSQASGQAQSGSGNGVQTATQKADSAQTAPALSHATQTGASNVSAPVRVGSPGDGGSVSQSNTVASSATTANSNGANQASTQNQAGGTCACTAGNGVQTSNQSASNDQSALAGSLAEQTDPKNLNVSVRVLSPGNDGSVSQSNDAGSSAQAGNDNHTSQTANQGQAQAHECGCGSRSIQTSDQKATNEQGAAALSAAIQSGAKNEASPVRVGSAGNDGAVTQFNTDASTATAGNGNSTGQTANQSQGGSGTAIQVAGQDASNAQDALAFSGAGQVGASNDASPVRVASPGSGGSVTQSNNAGSAATAENANATDQAAAQDGAASCGCGADIGIQVLGQHAHNAQSSGAASLAAQLGGRESRCECGGSSGNTANTSNPTRVGSSGDDGSVSQENRVESAARSANGNATRQSASQTEAGGPLAIQVLGQGAHNQQVADALSAAFQLGASNQAAPTRVGSMGGGGSATQTNAAGSMAGSGNLNAADQTGSQLQAGSKCGCSGHEIQTLGQWAGSSQLAPALSGALQRAPADAVAPTRVGSLGANGSSSQGNVAGSRGDTSNGNGALQRATQLE